MQADRSTKATLEGEEACQTIDKLRRRRSQKSWVQYRYVLMFFGFLGLASVFAMRVNINVDMVVMVNQSAIAANSNSSRSTHQQTGLPALTRLFSFSIASQDGPFIWDLYTQGLILGAFYYGYIITPIPGGRLAERFGAKWLFGVGTLLTGLLSLLIPYAAYEWGATGVVSIRILQGLGEGITYPAMQALIAHWVPVGERTTGVALIHTGGYFGVVAGMAISGALANSDFLGGWPSVFYVFGAWTVLWFVFWAIFVSSRPEDHPWASQEELDLILNDQGNQKPGHAKFTPWKKILQSPAVIAIGIAQFGANWLLYMLVTELPTYLGTVLHYDIGDNGMYSALPYLGAMCSGIVAGPFADYLRRHKYMTATNMRKLFNGIALFGPSMVLVAVTFVSGGVTTLVLFVMAGTLRGFAEASYLSAPIDIAPDYAGTIVGITVCFGNFTGFLVPWLTGLFIQHENSKTTWSYAFYVTAGMCSLSGLVYQFFSSSELQEWGLAPKPDQAEHQDKKKAEDNH